MKTIEEMWYQLWKRGVNPEVIQRLKKGDESVIVDVATGCVSLYAIPEPQEAVVSPRETPACMVI